MKLAREKNTAKPKKEKGLLDALKKSTTTRTWKNDENRNENT